MQKLCILYLFEFQNISYAILFTAMCVRAHTHVWFTQHSYSQPSSVPVSCYSNYCLLYTDLGKNLLRQLHSYLVSSNLRRPIHLASLSASIILSSTASFAVSHISVFPTRLALTLTEIIIHKSRTFLTTLLLLRTVVIKY